MVIFQSTLILMGTFFGNNNVVNFYVFIMSSRKVEGFLFVFVFLFLFVFSFVFSFLFSGKINLC